MGTYDEATHNKTRFHKLKKPKDAYFDTAVYKGRVEIIAEMFLAEANDRAIAAQSKAFVHLSGLGLGVWKKSSKQTQIQARAYVSVARHMNLSHIGVMHFSFLRKETCSSHLSKDICKKLLIRSGDGSQIRIRY